MTSKQRTYLTLFRAQFGSPQLKELTLLRIMRPAIIRGAVLVGLAILIRREHFEWSMFAAGAATAIVADRFWWARSTISFGPMWSQIIDWKEVDRLLENAPPSGATDAIS